MSHWHSHPHSNPNSNAYPHPLPEPRIRRLHHTQPISHSKCQPKTKTTLSGWHSHQSNPNLTPALILTLTLTLT